MADKEKTSFRITFSKETVEFMNEYKETHGASIQWFVEKSVEDRIEEMKIKVQLGEI